MRLARGWGGLRTRKHSARAGAKNAGLVMSVDVAVGVGGVDDAIFIAGGFRGQ